MDLVPSHCGSRAPLGVEEAVRYTIQAAAGLAAAHQQGVCHRNIKPANLLLDREGVIKIVGFTLAHVEAGGAASEAGVDDNLTRQGQVIGTFDYMSPEQAMDSSSVDRRADIYSLGCTLYWLLTGQPPYAAKAGMPQILAHRTRPIPSLCAARPEVPAAIDRVFQKMLAKTPAGRYASMQEVIADLEAGLAAVAPAATPAVESSADNLRAAIGLTLPAGKPSVASGGGAGRKPRRREKGLPIVPIVVSGVLSVLAFVFAFQYFQGKQDPGVAKLEAPQKSPARSVAPATIDPTPVARQLPAPLKETAAKPATPRPSAADEQAVARPAAPAREENPEPKPAPEPEPGPEPDAKPAPEPKAEPAEPEKAPPKPEDSRTAVPDEPARQRASKLLQDAFQDEIGNARTSSQKKALAQKMLRQSQTMEDDPAGRFALLERSCTLAKEANDPATALAVIDQTARIYDVDRWSKKSEFLAEMAKEAKMAIHHRALAEQALPLTRNAMGERRFEIAAELGELALDEASKALDPKLLAAARRAAKDSKQSLTRFHEYEDAKARLQQQPGDHAANLTAGRYECLVVGDWDTGLRKLAAGGDKLAAKELTDPKDADAQAAVGDGWWDLATDNTSVDQANLFHRAARWYEKALPQATGLLKAKLEKRLDSIKDAPSSSAERR